MQQSLSHVPVRARLITSVAVLFVLGGCTAVSTVQTTETLQFAGERPRIVLMPPDIRYYLLTAGGVPEPNAEWTEAARTNFMAETLAFAETIGADVTTVDKTDLTEDEIRYEALHSAVGSTIITNQYSGFPLATKVGAFDWSLGPEIRSIGERHNADYALFVFYRDYQASGGRVALGVLAALAIGAAVPMGAEQGFASLVDLKTGDIAWFNMVTAGSGELREAEGAAAAVKSLFKNIPTGGDEG